MPTYRKSDLLAVTLTALGNQTYPMELLEVVVVDDCSGDRTSSFLEGLATPFRLVPLVHEVNKGRAAARNTGIRAAGGELVVFLDDDMRAGAGLLESHVACHDAHPAAAVIGNALTAPELGPSTVFSYLDSRGVHKLPPDARMPARYFMTNNSSVPRSALLEAGLFDESFRSYGFEDMEIAFRLEEIAGLSFWYCSDAVAHHIHYHSLDDLLAKRLEGARSSLAHLLAKHPERARDLSVDVLLPISHDDPPGLRIRKRLTQCPMRRPWTDIARVLARLRCLGPLAHPLIDYLVATAYCHGLRAAHGTDDAHPQSPLRT
jgi:glycosyltransferase involved in cell wall biosynthesis